MYCECIDGEESNQYRNVLILGTLHKRTLKNKGFLLLSIIICYTLCNTSVACMPHLCNMLHFFYIYVTLCNMALYTCVKHEQ